MADGSLARPVSPAVSAPAQKNWYRRLQAAFDLHIRNQAPAPHIAVATEQSQDGTTAYQQVGGLSKEVAMVRELIELPLRSPALFSQLGIDPPKGVMLYGPPGCGKTLIARAVAHESGAYFINVNGAEIIQKHYGESEQMLRTIFIEAEKNAPSIIFFDEIDALAPNRETVLGDVEKRVVSQLLSLMDGVRSRGQIMLLAATNLPNSIDPALRRPGRFDREISINPPNKTGRLEILQIHTRRMPLADAIDLEKLAAVTHGFLGADLAALCREAAMNCAREAHAAAKHTGFSIAQEQLSVSMEHFFQALGEIKLSTTREMSSEAADVKWQDVGGLHKVRQVLEETVAWPLLYGARFRHAGTAPPKGILLTGRSGCGKTHIVNALAGESEINFINAKGPELLSKWVGESERGIREVFKRARQSAPCILFFDEIDAVAPMRGNGGGAQIGERMVGQLLLELDSPENPAGLLILAASNRPDLLDPALLRPGRFDFILDLPMPDRAARLEILQCQCRHRPIDADVDFADLATGTENMSGADLASLCQRAALLAIRQSVEHSPKQQFAAFTIGMHHFRAALAATRAAASC